MPNSGAATSTYVHRDSPATHQTRLPPTMAERACFGASGAASDSHPQLVAYAISRPAVPALATAQAATAQRRQTQVGLASRLRL